MKNIMDVLTPKPPFDPKRKNTLVDFGTPKRVIKSKSLKLK